jgi:hypothetical protein
VHAVTDQVLDTISASGPQWEATIRRLKFEAHNQEWLDVVQVSAGRGERRNRGKKAGNTNPTEESHGNKVPAKCAMSEFFRRAFLGLRS